MLSEDCQVAIQASMQTANRLGKDVAIMDDLSVVALEQTEKQENILEIIRCPSELKRK